MLDFGFFCLNTTKFKNIYIFYLPLFNSMAKKSSLVQKILEGHSYAYGLQKHILLTDQNTAEQSTAEQNRKEQNSAEWNGMQQEQYNTVLTVLLKVILAPNIISITHFVW
jgi:hypothetical protein